MSGPFPTVPPTRIDFSPEDRAWIAERISQVLESGRLTLGPFGEEFEKLLAASMGVKHAITVNSGRTLDLLNPATGSASTAEFTGVLSGTGNLFLPNSGGNGIEGILSFTNAASFTGNVVLSVSGAGNEHFKFASIGDGGNFTFAKNGHRQLITYTGAAPITFDTRQIVVATTMFNGGATDRQGMDGNGSNGVSIFANDATDIGSTVTFNTDMVVNNIASTYGVGHSEK